MAEVHTGWAARCHTDSPVSKFALMVLAVAADDDGVCLLSEAEIARFMQRSVRTARSALSRLEQAGLIERHPGSIFVGPQPPRGSHGGAA